MFEKSICGSTPRLNRFSPSVTRQTFPVRSPLPNRQPSMRSAPAWKPNSAAATAVPRSLCGCRLRITESRRARLRLIHSMESAYTLGVVISTVDGRLKMIGLSGVGSTISPTALHTSSAYCSSVPVYDSGEYWKRQWVSGYFAASSTHLCAPSVAIFLIASLSSRNTTRRCRIEVEL
ncbi:Uncharacterised protein [Mycobacteroides abscessus subsp. abscessus]|nr:Uncharacterised protein [Mycobacteroides abscessus subsp. abscessus]